MTLYVQWPRHVPTTTQSAAVRRQIQQLNSQMQSVQAAILRLQQEVQQVQQVQQTERSAEAIPVATAVSNGEPVGVPKSKAPGLGLRLRLRP